MRGTSFVGSARAVVSTFGTLPSRPRVCLYCPSGTCLAKRDVGSSVVSGRVVPVVGGITGGGGLPIVSLRDTVSKVPRLFPSRVRPGRRKTGIVTGTICSTVTGWGRAGRRAKVGRPGESFLSIIHVVRASFYYIVRSGRLFLFPGLRWTVGASTRGVQVLSLLLLFALLRSVSRTGRCFFRRVPSRGKLSSVMHYVRIDRRGKCI